MFFYIENAKSQDVKLLEKPWEFDTSAFPFDLPPAKYKTWWRSAGSAGCLLTLAATDYADGAYGTRIDKNNPARVLYGLKADYDNSVVDETYIARLRQALPSGCGHAPQWASISQGGHLHLFWLFEEPVRLLNPKHAEAFIHTAMERVKAKLFGVLLSDYDAKASEAPAQVFDVGKSWHPIDPEGRISSDVLRSWDYDAAMSTITARLRDKEHASKELPFEIVDELIRRHYPSANLPPLRPGLRCHRFWDPLADNPTAATPMPDGFLVFTPHDGGFRTWAQLFGADEVDRALGGSKAMILEDFFCLPRRSSTIFYQRMTGSDGSDVYRPIDRSDLIKYLRRSGFSAKARAGEAISEVEQAIITIREQNIVSSAAPFLFFRSGRIFGRELGLPDFVLNTSTVIPVAPASDPGVFSAGADFSGTDARLLFPKIYNFLATLFCRDREEYDAWKASGGPYSASFANKPLCTFLSWLAHFYRNAHRRTPSVGQAMYLVGPPGCGKSLLAMQLIPALMGGSAASGAQYFLDGGTFTREIAEAPVIVLDDAGSIDYSSRVQATQKIKSFVASGTLKYEAKGADAVTLPYRGRLICTSNDTERDLTVLPTIDDTTRDKFTFLGVGRANLTEAEKDELFGGGRGVLAEDFRQELPYFARFLLAWKTPEDLQDVRWGVAGYQDPAILRESGGSESSQWAELLVNYMLYTVIPVDAKRAAPAYGENSTPEELSQLARHVREMVDLGRLQPLRLTSQRLHAKLASLYPSRVRSMRGTVGSLQYMLTNCISREPYRSNIQVQTGPVARTWRISYCLLFGIFGEHFEHPGFFYDPPETE